MSLTQLQKKAREEFEKLDLSLAIEDYNVHTYERSIETMIDSLAKQAYLQGIRDAKDVLPPHDPYTREEMMSREGQNRDLDFLMCKKTGYNTYREETLEAITRLEENYD